MDTKARVTNSKLREGGGQKTMCRLLLAEDCESGRRLMFVIVKARE